MIGVAVVGTGVISERHIEAYLAFKDRCRILALCDLVPQKAKELKERYHLEDAEIYNSCEGVAARNDIRLVSICTPPFTHAQTADTCMRAGKHVPVEKPMAASLEECDEMIQIQEETGCYLGIISQNRYFQCEKAGLSAPWKVKCSRSISTGFPEENREFKERLQDLKKELPPEMSRDGRLAMEVITAVYQAGFTGRAVTLPLSRDSPFYARAGFLMNGKHFNEKKAQE